MVAPPLRGGLERRAEVRQHTVDVESQAQRHVSDQLRDPCPGWCRRIAADTASSTPLAGIRSTVSQRLCTATATSRRRRPREGSRAAIGRRGGPRGRRPPAPRAPPQPAPPAARRPRRRPAGTGCARDCRTLPGSRSGRASSPPGSCRARHPSARIGRPPKAYHARSASARRSRCPVGPGASPGSPRFAQAASASADQHEEHDERPTSLAPGPPAADDRPERPRHDQPRQRGSRARHEHAERHQQAGAREQQQPGVDQPAEARLPVAAGPARRRASACGPRGTRPRSAAPGAATRRAGWR